MFDRGWVAPRLPGQRPMAPCWRISATVALFVVMPLGLVAQEPFTDVQYALRTGDDVFVTDETGLETRGRVTEVHPFTLRLRVNGADRLWRWSDIDRLERRGDSLKNGIIAGLTTGGILGFFSIIAAFDAGGGGEAFPLLLSDGQIAMIFGVSMGIGAGIGAGLDALVPGRTLLYLRPTKRMSVVPVSTPSAQTIQLRFGF
jgi:hypothetical protein